MGWPVHLIATLCVVVCSSASQSTRDLHEQNKQSFLRRLVTDSDVHINRKKEVFGVLQAVETSNNERHTIIHETGGDGAEDAITSTQLKEVENIITKTSSPENSPVLASTISAIARMKEQIKHEHESVHSLKAPAPPPSPEPVPQKTVKPPVAPWAWAKPTVSVGAVSRPHSTDEYHHILCNGKPCDESIAPNSQTYFQRIKSSLNAPVTASTLTTIVALFTVSVVSVVVSIAVIKYTSAAATDPGVLQDPTHSEEAQHFMYEEANSPYQASRGIDYPTEL